MIKMLMSVDEVADRLQVSRSTIYGWIATKKIPFLRVGGRIVRFDPDVLASWLDEAKVRDSGTAEGASDAGTQGRRNLDRRHVGRRSGRRKKAAQEEVA